MTARFVTTTQAGLYRPGLTIDVIDITGTTAFDPRARDAHTSPAGDGQWYRVKHPNGLMIRMCRTPGELAGLGIDLGTLTEVTP